MNMIKLLEGISINELADMTLFDSIIQYHYEKFILLHSYINSIESDLLDKVKFCNCLTDNVSITVEVVTSKKNMTEMIEALESSLESFANERLEFLSIDINSKDGTKDTILIEINSITNESEEVILYAH